mmetsp:Transcript_25569/g.47674  ORF Transcript_25569/g.47674 Transcript_25569/m.47674 type:complete len:179 (-) Transcript_25569:167-703(-)
MSAREREGWVKLGRRHRRKSPKQQSGSAPPPEPVEASCSKEKQGRIVRTSGSGGGVWADAVFLTQQRRKLLDEQLGNRAIPRGLILAYGELSRVPHINNLPPNFLKGILTQLLWPWELSMAQRVCRLWRMVTNDGCNVIGFVKKSKYKPMIISIPSSRRDNDDDEDYEEYQLEDSNNL